MRSMRRFVSALPRDPLDLCYYEEQLLRDSARRATSLAEYRLPLH